MWGPPTVFTKKKSVSVWTHELKPVLFRGHLYLLDPYPYLYPPDPTISFFRVHQWVTPSVA